MSAFTAFDDFERIRGTRTRYILTADLAYEVGKKGSGWRAVVPKGTEFDLSVPAWLEWYVSPYDRHWLAAAALHDWFLKNNFDARFAASEFRRALEARAPGDKRIVPAYYGVLFVTT